MLYARTLILSSLITCMAGITMNAQPAKQLKAFFSAYDSAAAPGAAAAVIKNGKVVWKAAFGSADSAGGKPVTFATNFRLASVTKQFTATAVLQLCAHKKLTLQTTLGGIFPGFPAYGANITVHQLLCHTSGLLDYEDLMPDTQTTQIKDNGVLALMLAADSLYFPPGTQYRYSNTGYALLALVVEKISGKGFGEYLRQNVFLPAGMTHSLAHEEGKTVIPRRAYGNTRVFGVWRVTDQSTTSAVLGDGGIYASVNGLIAWNATLDSRTVLPKLWRDLSWERKTLADGSIIDYGYGFHRKRFNGREVVFHTGSTRGFRTVIYKIPSESITVIILTNRNEGNVEALAEQCASVFIK